MLVNSQCVMYIFYVLFVERQAAVTSSGVHASHAGLPTACARTYQTVW